MDIIINHHTQTPIYLQIVNQLKEMIIKGEITDGFVLPSERSMAKLLNVHRNTIIKAYTELKAEDFLASSREKAIQFPIRTERGRQRPKMMCFPGRVSSRTSIWT